jgi:hypothetical protein
MHNPIASWLPEALRVELDSYPHLFPIGAAPILNATAFRERQLVCRDRSMHVTDELSLFCPKDATVAERASCRWDSAVAFCRLQQQSNFSGQH